MAGSLLNSLTLLLSAVDRASHNYKGLLSHLQCSISGTHNVFEGRDTIDGLLKVFRAFPQDKIPVGLLKAVVGLCFEPGEPIGSQPTSAVEEYFKNDASVRVK